MNLYIIEREQVVPRPRSETFAFFGDAFNLERITPPFLRFRVLTAPPIEMREGTLLDYRLSLFGIPFDWRTRIEVWRPDENFTDVQIKGPYSLWRHTHSFEEAASQSTLMRDRVEYRLSYGLIGRLTHATFVRRTLNRIFDYRAEAITRLLGS